jgi:hypothetical protein
VEPALPLPFTVSIAPFATLGTGNFSQSVPLYCNQILHLLNERFSRFSAGTGRPPVLSRQYLDQCQNILNLSSFDSRDQLVAVGVKLYTVLCELVNADNVQTDGTVWHEIDSWKQDCGQFFGEFHI